MRAIRASRPDLVEVWGYDPAKDLQKLSRMIERIRKAGPIAGFAVALALTLLVLAVGDALGWSWVNDFGRQQVLVTVVIEAALLVIVVVLVDVAVERRQRREWD